MCFLFSDCCLVCSMGVVSLVEGQDGITADMIGNKSHSENYELPHPTMPLEYECKISPEGLACGAGVKFPCNLWFATYINLGSYRRRASQFGSKESWDTTSGYIP